VLYDHGPVVGMQWDDFDTVKVRANQFLLLRPEAPLKGSW